MISTIQKPKGFLFEIAVLISCLLLLTIDGASFADDPGVGWHIKTGEYIFKNFKIPSIDPFLYSLTPRYWISDQWLSDILIWILFDAASWSGVYLLFVSVFVLTFFVALYFGIRSESSLISTTIALIISLKLSTVQLILRPVVFAFFLFAIIYINSFKIIKLKKVPLKIFFSLPIIFLLWSNSHPSFPIGLLVLFSSLMFIFLQELSKKRFFESASLLILCTIATCINPYGLKLHKSIIQLGASEYFMRLNNEWLPLDLTSTEGKLLLIQLFIIFAAFIINRSFIKGKSWEIVVAGIFLYLTFKHVRFLPFYAITSALPFAYSLDATSNFIVNRYHKLEFIFKFFRQLEERERLAKRGGKEILLLGVICFILIWSFSLKITGPSKEVYPYKALEFILSKENSTVAVLSTPDWGGFLTFFGDDRAKAVLDDRNTLLGEGIYKEFFASLKDPDMISELMREFNAKYLLIPKGWALEADTKLTILYQDSISLLYYSR